VPRSQREEDALSNLGASNVNVNVNVAGGLSTAGGGSLPVRMNTHMISKVLTPRAFPAQMPSDATPAEKDAYERDKKAANTRGFREFWDAELRASIYVNEFVARNPEWLDTLIDTIKPLHVQLQEKKDEQLRAILARSDEREPRFAEIIDQHGAEGALKYWLGTLAIDPSTPATYQLVHVGRRLGETVVMCLKEYFGEARPSQVCPVIAPMIDPPITPAFPAGHALQSHLISILIKASERVLNQGNTLFVLSRRVAENRTIAGLHYPLDNDAGVEAAEKVFEMLTTEDPQRRCTKFVALLDAAKKENGPAKKPA
jgi:hypothetical protein